MKIFKVFPDKDSTQGKREKFKVFSDRDFRQGFHTGKKLKTRTKRDSKRSRPPPDLRTRTRV